MERPDKPLTPPDDRDRKRDRADKDRGERDRVDRDRGDRDRGDRDRGDRDRGDRDRGDRDRGDRDRGDRDRGDRDRGDRDRGDEKGRPEDRARGDDRAHGDDRAPAGEAASYFSAAAPVTGPNGAYVSDTYRPPQEPVSSYPPRHDYGLPPPGSGYVLPSQSTAISPNYHSGPAPNGASASYYGGAVESMPGPAATSGVGMNYVTPAPLSGPLPHGGRPLQSTTPLPLAVQSSFDKPTLKSMRQRAENEVNELSNLQRQRKMVAARGTRREYDEISDKIRAQTATVLGYLKGLRQEMIQIVEDAEDQRWRRWIVGSIFGTFIPLVKKLFRRPSSEKSKKTTRTEYAFIKSKSLLGRILAATRGHRPGLATVTFFVFAVLYIFSNEVSLRVAKTASKRLKKLINKVENTSTGRDGDVLKEDDIKLMRGWRWRVLEFVD